MNPDEPRSPHAEPATARDCAGRPRSRGHRRIPEPDSPNVEIIETPGLPVDPHRAPAGRRPRVARGALRLPPPRLRGRPLAQPAPEGRRVRGLPLRRPALPALRQGGRAAERRRGSTSSSAPTSSSRSRTSRCSPSSTSSSAAARGRTCATSSSARARLPAVQDRRRLRRRVVPDAQQDGQQARAHRGRHLRGPLAGGGAGDLRREAGDHQLPQDRPAAALGAARSRADPALRARGPRGLLRRHPGRERARLGPPGELQGGHRGARGDERVGALRTRSTTSCAC